MTAFPTSRLCQAALLSCALLWPHLSGHAQQESSPPEVEAAPPTESPTSLLPNGVAPEPATPAVSPAPAPAPAPGAASSPVSDATDVPAPGLPDAPSTALGTGGTLAGRYGLGPAAWSRSTGGFATQLMLKMGAGSASRYQHILMRRLLLTPGSPPAGADPVKFLNARSYLLLRMGEVEAAKMLLATLPQQAYLRQTYAIAAQAHMAAIDLPSACPLATRAIIFSPDAQWPLISGVCSALQGDEGGAALGLDIARQEGKVNRFDLSLAEQMVTALSGGGRGSEIAWPDKGIFTSYRVGGVYTSGQRFPRQALLRAPVVVQSWLARSGAVDSDTRWALAWTATARGVMSGAEFSSLWAARGSVMDDRARAYRAEGVYMRAFSAPKLSQRRAAFRQLGAMGKSEAARKAIWALMAAPAAAFPVRTDQASFAPEAVRAMIMGGRPRDALRWWPVLSAGKGVEARAVWALLLAAVGDKSLPATQEWADEWTDAQAGEGKDRRIEITFAALQGLGYALKAPLGKNPGDPDDNAVFAKLADAANRGARGEVVLLAHLALGSSWATTDPASLAAVLRAYRRVGLGAEARMIAAEAMISSGA